jgi:SPX domain protein involved in polyphosphate accumulation
MPSTKLRKSLINEIKDQFIKYKDHKDRIDMKEKWNSTGTREKKLIKALEMILDKNLTQKDKFDL